MRKGRGRRKKTSTQTRKPIGRAQASHPVSSGDSDKGLLSAYVETETAQAKGQRPIAIHILMNFHMAKMYPIRMREINWIRRIWIDKIAADAAVKQAGLTLPGMLTLELIKTKKELFLRERQPSFFPMTPMQSPVLCSHVGP